MDEEGRYIRIEEIYSYRIREGKIYSCLLFYFIHPILVFYFLHHKPLALIGFMKAKMDSLLPVSWGRFRFYIVTPRMLTFSLAYVENVRIS